jgi:hypothetical protein
LDFLVTDGKIKGARVPHVSGNTGIGGVENQDTNGLSIPGTGFGFNAVDICHSAPPAVVLLMKRFHILPKLAFFALCEKRQCCNLLVF